MKKNLFNLFIVLIVLFIFNGCQDKYKKKGYYYDNTTDFTIKSFETADTSFVNCGVEKWPNGKEKVVVFTWDDCCHGISGVREIFDKYNIKTTFFVNTAIIDNWYVKIRLLYKGSISRVLKNALKKGHEVSSHTHDHLKLTDISLTEVENQLKMSSNTIFEHFGYYPSTFSHPQSYYNETIDSLMRLYYLDSRYSVKNDSDTLIRYLQIRSSYQFEFYKNNFDSFILSTSDQYVYGGHQLRGGYEPIAEATLDSLLSYITEKYSDICWITTYEDVVLYKRIREAVTITNDRGVVKIDISRIKDILSHYSHPHALLTLKFERENLDFLSDGLVNYWYDGEDTYCTVDLRKTNELRYKVVEKNMFQQPMRNRLY